MVKSLKLFQFLIKLIYFQTKVSIYFYYLLKLSELIETMFYVLRKKDNQISQLHVFHHVVMSIGSFVNVKYIKGIIYPFIIKIIHYYLNYFKRMPMLYCGISKLLCSHCYVHILFSISSWAKI